MPDIEEGKMAPPKRPLADDRAFRIPCIGIALIIGFIQVWVNRFYMSYDGVSYLDMADAYLRRDWHTAFNVFWNPLYSWIIGFAFLVLHPNAYWEYPVVHLVNFLIYAGTVAAFEYFLQALLKGRGDASAIRIIAYALFLWTSLEMIHVWMVNPDMLVAASVYLALGVLLRPSSRWSSILLGLTLSAGYYAKPVMIPIGCIVLLASWKILPRRQWVVATLAFALLSSPLILVLSNAAGHLTIGETGRLNFAWWIDGVEQRNWQGGPVQAGLPVHPARVALDHPRVYEFGGVFPVTYAMWYDVSYWFRGLHVWWAPRSFAHNMIKNLAGVARLMLCQGGGFLVGWAFCFYRGNKNLVRLGHSWRVWAVSLGAIVLYCAVHCETRYLGGFFAVAFLIPFAALQIEERWLAISVAALGLVCAAFFFRVTPGERFRPWESTPVNTYWQVATGLQNLGLTPGDKVGLACGEQGMPNSRWARLARVHIVAEMDRDIAFWQLSEKEQKEVLDTLSASGAKMAVTSVPPPNGAHPVGWIRIGSTTHFAYRFFGEPRH